MPRKRAAPAPSSTSTATKRSRKSTDSDDTSLTTEIPRSTRWSAVSASRNADHDYKLLIQDPAKAYEFLCMYNPPFTRPRGAEDDDEEEDGDHSDSTTNSTLGTKKMDGKPATDHPNHPYTITLAGRRRFYYIDLQSRFRNPDRFGMYTFNDHTAYGAMEVIENVVLDYEEARKEGNYREQWAICEGLGLLFGIDGAGPMTMCDDGERVDEMMLLIGRMFLDTLAQFERDGLLGQGAEWEIKNLGMVMGLFMAIPTEMRPYGLLEESEAERLGLAKDKKKWTPHEFDQQIVAYAKKYGIKLVAPHNIEELVKQIAEGDLPVSSNTDKSKKTDDVFGFVKALKKYKAQYGQRGGKIGGDSLDITSWASAERKKHSFNKKDPLGKNDLDALKDGGIMTWG